MQSSPMSSRSIGTTISLLTTVGYGLYNYLYTQASTGVSGIINSFTSFEPARALVPSVNPFEYVNICLADQICGLLDAPQYPWLNELMGEAAYNLVGEYAQPFVGIAGQGMNYLPAVAAGTQFIGMMNDVRQGHYRAAARKALNIGSTAMITVAVPYVGMVAVPAGLVAQYGLSKALERFYPISKEQAKQANILGVLLQQGRGFTVEESALALGVTLLAADNGQYQIMVNGQAIGQPVSSQTVQALAVYASPEGITNFGNVLVDYENQTVTLGENGTAIPFAEIEALYKLNFEDLPALIQLGIISMSVADNGQVTLTLHEDQVPAQYKGLTDGAKKLVKMLEGQNDKSMTVNSDRQVFKGEAPSYQDIQDYQRNGVVPVQTSNGPLLVPTGVIGMAMSKALKVEDILSQPEEDGTLMLKIAEQKVPVRDAQRAAQQLVEDKVKSLEEMQREILSNWGLRV